MIAVMTEQGRFIRVNPAWQQALGYGSEELVGHSLWHFAHPEDRAEGIERTRVVSEGEDVQDVRVRMRDISGDYRWFSWNVGAASADGRCYAVVRDVTEQVDAETQQAELMAVLEMHAMSLAEQAHEMDRLRVEAEFVADHDGLTGCLNRRAWFEWGTNGRPTAVAIYDIDHFKRINDTYGHPAGDEVLQGIAKLLQAECRTPDVPCRYGGEEFVLVMPSTGPADAAIVAERIRESLMNVVWPRHAEHQVTISIGLVGTDSNMADFTAEQWLEAADKNLYTAKHSGRNKVVATDMVSGQRVGPVTLPVSPAASAAPAIQEMPVAKAA